MNFFIKVVQGCFSVHAEIFFVNIFLHLDLMVCLHKTLSQLNNDSNILLSLASWKKFHVTVAGRTNGAHKPIVDWLSASHREVSSPQDSDYLLIFCPVASRVGTDIGEALQDIPGRKFVWSLFGQSDQSHEQDLFWYENIITSRHI